VEYLTFRHPEADSEEMFIANVDDEAWEESSWRTKRDGEVTYHPDTGERFDSKLFPMFIEMAEYVEAFPDRRAEVERTWRKVRGEGAQAHVTVTFDPAWRALAQVSGCTECEVGTLVPDKAIPCSVQTVICGYCESRHEFGSETVQMLLDKNDGSDYSVRPMLWGEVPREK
jgi:hypothetical protein